MTSTAPPASPPRHLSFTSDSRVTSNASGEEGAAAAKAAAPEPDDRRKPDSPAELPARSWKYTAKSAFAEFQRDGCLDMASALTFNAVTAIFPALVVLISLIGVFGSGAATADSIVGLIEDLGQPDVADQLRDPITRLASSDAAGVALILGVLGGLWSASGYVGAFGRAMNRIYETDEGRPFWKLRPLNLVITVVALVAAALVLLGLTVTGPVAAELGARIGLSDAAVTVWNIAKWPAVLAVVMSLVALLYYATPNVRQPRFRWISVGAAFAIVVWILGTIGFGVYVANFGSYDRTYGSLAGVIVLLMWLWLTNIALLLGGEIDAELERARQLEGGIEAEETLQLPPRGTTASEKSAAKLADQIEHGRQLRLQAAGADVDGADGPEGVGNAGVEDGDREDTPRPLDDDDVDDGDGDGDGHGRWAAIAVVVAGVVAAVRELGKRSATR